MVLIIAKFVCLFLVAAYGCVIVARISYKQDVYAPQVVLLSIGVAGFITLQWVI